MKNLPAPRPCHENITLLAISPDREDRLSLQRILDLEGWTVQGAQSVREATQLLCDHPDSTQSDMILPDMILCENQLPDGSWRDVVRIAGKLENPPPVVVVSRHADQRLWAEVLNLGAYDLLLKPFRASEVSRVVGMARRHGQQHESALSAYA